MNNNSELNRQRWREGLFQTFAAEGNSREKCIDYGNKFDQLTEGCGMSGEGATGILYAAHGSRADAREVCLTIKDWVKSELEHFNATHQGIDNNPATRLKRAIKTLNENIDKCCILIDGQPLSVKEISRIKAVVPNCLQSPTIYQATANDKSGKTSKLVLEVKI